MSRFVDTHCHGIPLVDDGVQSEASALILLRQAAESQIRVVFMTPHVMYHGKYFPDKKMLQEKIKVLQAQADAAQLPIEIRLGSEIMIFDDSLTFIKEKAYWGYQDTDYVLIEFMPPFEDALIHDTISELNRQNKKIIVAHPERYFSDPKVAINKVKEWKESGVYFQVNRTSIYLSKKPLTRVIALALIENNLISIIASDAHHAPGKRECRMADVHRELTRLYGEKAASVLCEINPSLLAENKNLRMTQISNGFIQQFMHKLKTIKIAEIQQRIDE